MAALDDLVAGLQLSDEEKRQARGLGFLQFGLGLLGTRRGRELQAIGQAGTQGLLGYRQELDNARLKKLRDLQARGAALDLVNHESQYNDAELLRRQQQDFARRFGGVGAPVPAGGQVGPSAPTVMQIGPPTPSGELQAQPMPRAPTIAAPSGPPPLGAVGGSSSLGTPRASPATQTPGPAGGVPSKREVAQRYQGYGDYWMSLGRPEKAQTYYELAQKSLPQIKEQRTLTQNGRRVVVNVYNDGSHEVLPDVGPDQEKAHFLNTGKTVAAVDPFTGQPVAGGGSYAMQTTPGEDQTAATTMRGQNMTDARSRDQNSIALGNRQIEQVHTIRKELNSLPDVQSYRAALPMLKSAQTAPNTRAGDLDVIYAVGKALDPGSVVREGELNLVIKSGNLPQQLVGATSYVMAGGKLPPEQRAELMAMLQNRVGQLKSMHDVATVPYRRQAEVSGLPADQIFVEPVAARGAGGAASTGGAPVLTSKATANMTAKAMVNKVLAAGDPAKIEELRALGYIQ